MACDSYTVTRGHASGWAEGSLYLTYDHPDYPCMCTWRGDHEELDARHVRTLALLGAALVLANHGVMDSEYIYTPTELPPGVEDMIRRAIPAPDAEEED